MQKSVLVEEAAISLPPEIEGMRDIDEKIHAVSMWLFAQQGFAGTTMREIAKFVGISHTSIWRRYDSKDKLRSAINDRVLEKFHSFVEENTRPGEGDGDPIYRVLKNGSALFVEEQLTYMYLSRLILETDEFSKNLFRRYFKEAEGMYRSLINQGAMDEGWDLKWLSICQLLLTLGPLLLKPHIENSLGGGLFDEATLERRNKVVYRFFTGKEHA